MLVSLEMDSTRSSSRPKSSIDNPLKVTRPKSAIDNPHEVTPKDLEDIISGPTGFFMEPTRPMDEVYPGIYIGTQ